MQAERKLTGYPSVDKPWLKYYAQEEVEEIPHRKIYTHLWECNRNHLHDTALLYYGRKITFSELFAQVDTVARAYGDRISTVNEAPYEAGKLAGIVYTSGTTGIPKGAGLSNDDLVAQSVNMYHALFLPEHGRHLRFLNIMPPWLAYGLTCAMSSILCMGMQMDIIPMLKTRCVLVIIRSSRLRYCLRNSSVA